MSAGARRWRLAFSIAAFLAAVALTYGWGLFTGQNGLATGSSFALRSIFSVLLVFLGIFTLTGLWGHPAAPTPLPVSAPPPPATPATAVSPAATSDTPAIPTVPVLTPAAATAPMPPLATIEAHTNGDIAPSTASQPVPTHRPVPAANLPRILFDTDEMPAITSLTVSQADREKRQRGKPLPPPYPDTPGKPSE